MSPRYLGCRVVLVRSFARIHETNLKKQGVLPLIFADPADYERIQKDDRLSFAALDRIAPGKPVNVQLKHADGRVENIEARHSLTSEQIAWFMAGSAINLIRTQFQNKMASDAASGAAWTPLPASFSRSRRRSSARRE